MGSVDRSTSTATANASSGRATPRRLPERRSRGHVRREVVWTAAVAGAAAVLALLRLVGSERFYFVDDTQTGAWPIWVTLGESLMSGSLPFFEPGRWMAGNIAAEGQWGLLNPMIWAIGLLAAAVPSGVAVSTLVKVAFLAVAASGVFRLTRSFGASRQWAFVGGLLATTTGFTVYIDATSWVTALMVWALLPWAWWGLRVTALEGRNVLWTLVPGYLLVTVGYVHGTLMLVAAILGVLVESLLVRDRGAALRAFLTSSLLGLVAVATYLPGLLAAPVTARDSQAILNSNFMSADLSGLASSAAPTGRPWLTGFWAVPVEAPLMYVAWLLPAFALVAWARVPALVRGRTSLVVVLVAAAALVFGASEVGPLRFPARVLPYLATALIMVLVVLLSRARKPFTRTSVVALVLWSAASAYLAYSEAPLAVRSLLVGSVLATALLVLTAWATADRPGAWRPPVVAASVAAGSAVLVLVQSHYFPISPLEDFDVPSDRTSYAALLAEAPGDTVVLGSPLRSYATWDQTTYANGWLLAEDADVINTYSPLMYERYAEELCADAHGTVCWEALGTLMSTDDATGVPVVDLLGISSIQILSREDEDPASLTPQEDPYTYATPPAGWVESVRNDGYALWVRETPVPGAGGVTWTSPGVTVTTTSVTNREVRLTVDEVPAAGGTVVLSRLGWPGYSVSGAGMTDLTRDYLVTLDLAGTAPGTEVVLSFTPAGWNLGLGVLAVAFAGGALLAVGDRLAARRTRATTPTA